MAQNKAPNFTLYEHRASPFCVAIRIALAECDVAFTPREVDLDKPRTAAFKKRSPFGSLPALVEHRASGELAIFETVAILAFLAERFPQSTLGFDDLASKSQGMSWLSFMATAFANQLWEVLKELHAKQDENRSTARITACKAELETQLKVLEEHLARRAFLAGDYSIADTLATPLLDLLDFVEDLNMDLYTNVLSWRERLRTRLSYKNAWPQEKE